jgi:hypothetical protein
MAAKKAVQWGDVKVEMKADEMDESTVVKMAA